MPDFSPVSPRARRLQQSYFGSTMLKNVASQQIFMQMKCPECGSAKIARQNSEKFCQKCGFVLEDGTFSGS
jgi:predicted RNA-binding Zn-ribbon protein involved in translation (DUF1610 family)